MEQQAKRDAYAAARRQHRDLYRAQLRAARDAGDETVEGLYRGEDL